jgi:hypothetical protein
MGTASSIRTGLGMASAKGELSLVVVKVVKMLEPSLRLCFQSYGIVTIVTTFIAPYIIRFGAKLRSAQDEWGSTASQDDTTKK